ncbi:RagB/SusD family nutrient uptake outer membrane protein [Negadavirga shengliensis]|uniref:RagB/SusD family nutrient uptake outer membrane protein n=1 Tax=Negadavirga shengliensis TaxID=1389218 RepID=A0ABV9T5D4_9BACT
MKKINYTYRMSVLSFTLLLLTACSDDFLQEKRDLTGVNEQVFEDPMMATAYVDHVYHLFQPANNNRALIWDLYGGFEFSKDTDELPGQSAINRPYAQISYNQDHALKYFGARMGTSVQNNTWTRMRQINQFLAEIDNHGLPEGLRNELKGQMYFWRAWQYFDMVKLYGGVPIVLEPQNPILAEAETTQVPRSSTARCIEQIVEDLDQAIAMLPGKWDNANWGRITSGAAAAFKGRVLLTWASPQFNRDDSQDRWQRAYEANMEAKNILEASGFGLYKNGNLENGEAWEKMWFEEVGNPEAVMIYGFNTVTSDQTRKNNGWERACRPREIGGAGQITPTKQMMDAFPMADGKKPGESTVYNYEPNKFYKNRDPRFYKTFVYNGAHWPYREDQNYRHWSYRWFRNDSEELPNGTTETVGANASGIYMRKATDPQASNVDDFVVSGLDVMEIRFAEVILNLAESAIGIGNISDGLNGIMEIRERAGVENLDGTFGIGIGLSRDQAFAAVINERKVELAYEGRRYWDLRRWMLFDNSHGTVSRLGMEPIHGTRRKGIFVAVKDESGNFYQGAADPLLGSNNSGAPVLDRHPETYPPGVSNEEEYLDYLYENHFEVIEKDDLDPTNPVDWSYTWFDEYYFFGLHQEILDTSPYLQQTKGWNSMAGPGTFDPLAD